MDFLQMLFSFIIIGIVLTISVSYVNLIAKPYIDIKKYSMTTAFILSLAIFITYNKGILTALEIPIDGLTNQPWFHYVDIAITAIVGTGGAKGVRAIIKGIEDSIKK